MAVCYIAIDCIMYLHGDLLHCLEHFWPIVHALTFDKHLLLLFIMTSAQHFEEDALRQLPMRVFRRACHKFVRYGSSAVLAPL